MDLPIEVAENIYQIELPLPFALRSVNCYLLRDEAGWTIVDTGLNTSLARGIWQETFAALKIAPDMIGRIVLTHSHPDHFGLAGWLQELGRQASPGPAPPVLMSPLEVQFIQATWSRPQDEWFQDIHHFFAWCGMPEELISHSTGGVAEIRQRTRPHPQVTELIKPGETIAMGGRKFQIIHTPGHSDGHLIFYDEADRLVLCGDQVLMSITPNISRWHFSEFNPLKRYLDSLQQLASLKVRLGLPGHRALITDWPGRVAELQAHHAVRLERMLAATDSGATPFQVSREVFDFSNFTPHDIRFAVAETLAHLDYLVWQEKLSREDNSIWWFVTR
jgi:glyoxylase-like metal-dependent hydrolase (beta-lactamase superfamily II)